MNWIYGLVFYGDQQKYKPQMIIDMHIYMSAQRLGFIFDANSYC